MDLKSISAKEVYVHEYFNVSHEICYHHYPHNSIDGILHKRGTQ